MGGTKSIPHFDDPLKSRNFEKMSYQSLEFQKAYKKLRRLKALIEIMFYSIFGSLVAIIMLSFTCYRIFTKKGFITEEHLNEAHIKSMTKLSDEEWKESLPMKKKRINRWITIALGLILIPSFFIAVIPFSLDLGYIALNDIPTFEGVVVSEVIETNRRGGTQLVTIQNEDNDEELRITIRIGNRQQGDFIRVRYLPFTRQGAKVGRR